MKIKTRLYISSTILVCLVGIVLFIMVLSTDKINEKYKRHELAHDINLAISQLDVITYEYFMYYEKRMEVQWHLKYDSTVEILAAVTAGNEEIDRELGELMYADFATVADLFSRLTVNHKKRQDKNLFKRELLKKRLTLLFG